MAITKQVRQRITVLETGHLEVLNITDVIEDGVILVSTNHREVIVPGQNVATKSERIRALAGLIHTPEVIAASRAR